MHTLSCATVAFVASFAAAKAEAPTDRSLPFADIADPAARAACEAMAQKIEGLKTSGKDLSGELDAQKTHSAAVEARLGKAGVGTTNRTRQKKDENFIFMNKF